MGGQTETGRDAQRRGLSTAQWLESASLVRLVNRVAKHRGLALAEVPDLLQEVRIALWGAGPSQHVQVAWIASTASHKAVDACRRLARSRARDRAAAVQRQRHEEISDLRHLLSAKACLLPPRLRRFYELHYIQGWSEREIVRRFRICRASVRWLDELCRRRLLGSTRSGPGSRTTGSVPLGP